MKSLSQTIGLTLLLSITVLFTISSQVTQATCNGPLTISGRVTDTNGNSLGAATITVTYNAASGYTAIGTTNASGYFQILEPPNNPVWYEGLGDSAKVSSQGYSTLTTTVYISSCPYYNSIALAVAPTASPPQDYTPYYLPVAIIAAAIIISITISRRKKSTV